MQRALLRSAGRSFAVWLLRLCFERMYHLALKPNLSAAPETAVVAVLMMMVAIVVALEMTAVAVVMVMVVVVAVAEQFVYLRTSLEKNSLDFLHALA